MPIDGLLTDLKRRGLLDSTLVIWGGEFGRMPVSQGNDGRDHNPHGFLAWMAGAGIKGGVSYGETDEIGYKAAVDRGQRPRPARHDAAPAWAGPQAADLLPQRPPLPPDRRGRRSDPADSDLTFAASYGRSGQPDMQYRTLGRTGLEISVVSFGAGPISTLMVGNEGDRQRCVVEYAIEQGVNWFDTAATYGGGQSEANLGRATSGAWQSARACGHQSAADGR